MRTISQPAAREPLGLVDGARRCRACRSSSSTGRGSGWSPPIADVADAHLAASRGAAARRDRPGRAGSRARPSPARSSRSRSKASSIFAGSRPPAWAKSGRPPPFPPTTAAVSRIRSPARKRVLQIGRHAEREGHLSSARAASSTMPAAERARAARRPSRAAPSPPAPSTFAASTLHAGDLLDLVGEVARRRAALLGAQRARARARGARRSSSSFSTRTSSSPTGERSSSAVRSSARSCSRQRRSASAPVSASMRRTPAATPDSETTFSRPMSPVARAWVPPQSSFEKSPKRDDAHEVAVLLAEHRDGAGRDRLAVGHLLDHAPARSRAIQPFTRSSIVSSCSRVTGASWLKSKRRRPGVTSEPRCVALCAEHLAQRRVQQVRARVVAHGAERGASSRPPAARGWSTCTSPRTTLPRWTTRPPAGRCTSSTSMRPVGVSITPRSPTWPPLSA